MSLKSGTNSFHGVGYDFMRRKALAANSFLLNSRNSPEDRSVHRSVRVQRRWPDLEEQDLLPVHRREVPRRHARPAVQHGADASVQERRLQQSRGRLGQPDSDLRPGDRPGCERRVDARSVPRQQNPGGPHQPDGPGDHEVLPGRRTTSTRPLRRGSGTWPGPSTSTRTCSGTGSARSTTTSARTTGPSSAGPRTSGNEIGNRGNAIRSGPAQAGQLPLIRSNRAIVADWVHIFGAGKRLQPARRLYELPGVELSTDAFDFDATEFWPASLVSQFPSHAARRPVPADRARPVRDPVARHHSQPEQELVAPAERVVDPRRAQHPQRPRHAVDQRPQRELQQLRWPGAVQPRLHAPHAGQHRRARRERLRLVPARRAERRHRGYQPHGPLQVVLRGALDPGRLARHQQADVEPRLPLGHQRFRHRSERPAELRLRPDDRQPGVGARGSAGAGRHPVRRRGRRAGSAVEARQEQLPGPRRRGLLHQRQDRPPRRLRQVLPQPDQSGQQCRVLLPHGPDRLD